MARSIQVVDGAEVAVETGVGTVKSITVTDGKRNARVEFDVPGLQYPVYGWADSHDSILMATIRTAYDRQDRVGYRIEVKRKDQIDLALPLDKVAKTDKFKALVDVDPRPSECIGSPQAPPKAQEGAQAPPTDDAPHPADTPAQAPQGAASGPSGPRRGAKVAEGKPWEPFNSDGSLNLGSYEVLAAVAMVDLAHELLMARRVEAPGPMPTMGQVKGLAHSLLAAADAAQALVRDGHVDRMDSSHARARGAVRTALEAHPVPWGATEEHRQAWIVSLGRRAGELLTVAIGLAR